MDPSQPAKYWRQMLMTETFQRFHVPPGADPDQRFHQLLADQYERARAELSTQDAAAPNAAANRIAVYFSAIGLLTYGRLDVVADILNNNPGQPSPLWALESSVAAIVPLPSDLDVHRQPQEVIAWIRENEPRLKWNESSGRFVLTEHGEGREIDDPDTN
jgi:hypothetical protein